MEKLMQFFIFVSFLMFFCVLLFMLLVDPGILMFFVLEWQFLNFKFLFYFYSLSFGIVLFLVTMTILIFCSYYMEGEINFVYFFVVLFLFVGSMFFLNFSNSGFCMLMSWDLLGITSYFLVLFYNNWDSCSGAMNTVLTNRVGDYFLFLFFSGVMFGSFTFLYISMFYWVLPLLLVLAGFTKSAQFPFSGWLPKAMSAPTPVSALVHSSTLVTAGLILIMNFGLFLMTKNLMIFIFIIGLFTMFFSSLAALVEEDMKKVVALSTLSQMGFAALTIGLGLNFISLLHLLSHALFKSCLFIQVGFMIHCSFGQQDGRNYFNLHNLPFFMQLQMLVTLFCLCGLFFSSGAVTKDYILEFFFIDFKHFIIGFMFFLGVFFTFGYSGRLWKSMFLCFKKVVSFNLGTKVSGVMSLMLVFLSVCYMWWVSMNFFCVPSLFLYLDFFVPLFYLGMFVCLLFFGLKFYLLEYKYKFFVDYAAKHMMFFLQSSKFLDMFLEKINFFGYNLLSINSLFFNLIFKNVFFNVIIILVFFLMILS